ncbi:hypothetical protein GN958_ATG20006 [Phytophthora infestans]|uniref:Uncharacterized protein n=1 Tax=Phytophthora infestans TaxID=4787 RepID=A0A8S9TTE5_PHYIN|nr:hypothetical protein GN958_ATG20006 [Phytophthora infestans]
METAPRRQSRAAETPIERDARIQKERLKRAKKRAEETPAAQKTRLAEERQKRASKRAEDTPLVRTERLEKDRARRARVRAGRGHAARKILLAERQAGDRARRSGQRRETGAVVSVAMEELGAGALSCGNFSGEEIAFLGSSQRYTSDPRLALAYRHCFGVDPAGFVFGDEQLHGGKWDVTRERLMNIFDDYPKPNDLTACQNLAGEGESGSTDIWACASCGRVLLHNKKGDKIVFLCFAGKAEFCVGWCES